MCWDLDDLLSKVTSIHVILLTLLLPFDPSGAPAPVHFYSDQSKHHYCNSLQHETDAVLLIFNADIYDEL